MYESNKLVFLVNPVAGKLSEKKKIQLIKDLFPDIICNIVLSKNESHAKEVSLEFFRKKYLVVACGGDGFIRLIAQKAVESGGTFALLPFGRGNDFANSLGLISLQVAANAVSIGRIKRVRYLELVFSGEERPNRKKICLTCAGVGLLSEAAARASKMPILKGRLLYAISALICFIPLNINTYIIKCDEEYFEEELLISVGAVGRFTGGGLYVAPEAGMYEKRVNLVQARKVNRFSAIKLLGSVFKGTHLLHPKVDNRHFQKIDYDTLNKNSLARSVYGDGELLGYLPCQIVIGEKPFLVCC